MNNEMFQCIYRECPLTVKLERGSLLPWRLLFAHYHNRVLIVVRVNHVGVHVCPPPCWEDTEKYNSCKKKKPWRGNMNWIERERERERERCITVSSYRGRQREDSERERRRRTCNVVMKSPRRGGQLIVPRHLLTCSVSAHTHINHLEVEQNKWGSLYLGVVCNAAGIWLNLSFV